MKNYKKYYKNEYQKNFELDNEIERLKRNDRNIWIPFSFIGFILITLGLSMIIFENTRVESYTIYKTECHNETVPISFTDRDLTRTYDIIPGYSQGCFSIRNVTGIFVCINQSKAFPINFEIRYISNEYFINNSQDNNLIISAPTEIKCGKKKVDEIPLNCNPKDYNYKDYPKECLDLKFCLVDCNYWSSVYFPIYKDDSESYQCNCKIPNIKKSDITKEWLDNNCECSMKINSYTCVNPSEGYTERKDCGDKDNKNNLGKCKEYKCGIYTVEVI